MLRTYLSNRLFSLSQHTRSLNAMGIETINRNTLFNPTVAELYQIAFKNEPPSDPYTRQSYVSLQGALCSYSGLRVNPQPKNSRIVKDDQTEKTVDWTSPYNIPMESKSFDMIKNIAVDFINHKGRCFIIDGYAGWDKNERVKVRTYCTRTYHALFMKNMLVRPTQKEIDEDFSKGADINIFNAGQMNVSKNIPGINDNMATVLNLSNKMMVILGTQFAGELNKGIFKILNYYYPRRGLLPLHSSALLHPGTNTTTLMCGLVGTGKTALTLRSTQSKVIGDDQICWGNKGIFNLEGGCYAKINNLSKQVEPQVYNSIKFGSLVENAGFFRGSRQLNFNDSTITPVTRACFPIDHLPHPQLPAVGPHPKNIIFLTCDTKGVLPPVAKLSKQQAVYQYLSGYASKLDSSNNMSQKVPVSFFETCFAETSLSLSPITHAKMLYDKIKKHDCNVWLVNTGWINGKYGIGSRIPFKNSLNIIDKIINGTLEKIPTYKFRCFNFEVPETCPGIQDDLMHPQRGWSSKVQYDQALSSLAVEFIQNYDKRYKGKWGQKSEIDNAGPVLL